MNKLEVGMWVRTKIGIIAKCTNILEDCSYDFDRVVYQDNYNEDGFMEIPYLLIDKYITKSSYNIIDLIEVGDYVNGYLVLNVLDFNDNTRILSLEKIYNYNITDDDIKSIVTKEQFEEMKYEVE